MTKKQLIVTIHANTQLMEKFIRLGKQLNFEVPNDISDAVLDVVTDQVVLRWPKESYDNWTMGSANISLFLFLMDDEMATSWIESDKRHKKQVDELREQEIGAQLAAQREAAERKTYEELKAKYG